MRKRRLISIITAAVLTLAVAQDGNDFGTRLSILENRVGRIEVDVSRLSDVPVSLARIEQKLTALAEKTDGQGSVLLTVGLGIVMSLITGGISYGLGRKSQK